MSAENDGNTLALCRMKPHSRAYRHMVLNEYTSAFLGGLIKCQQVFLPHTHTMPDVVPSALPVLSHFTITAA